ncbi:RNA recognition motif containing protein, polyadenylation factor subunit CstF64 [Histoplasma capsulatum var. duboisii H88]|uniref:RNA recognition motif containing protein, polyadenylation factor subunit CstF64 n=1 Tax=Ajellomyces capsulatus (strain H88) TaxID=544711 RepID=A0A8A1LV16_AJEC8|nr:RNA recognition motif containing protein, polyadenylation factor subunit CstF64 [Histoplasma capsulatum var. duboisii H88]
MPAEFEGVMLPFNSVQFCSKSAFWPCYVYLLTASMGQNFYTCLAGLRKGFRRVSLYTRCPASLNYHP